MEGKAFEAPLPDRAIRIGTAEGCDVRLACDGMGPEQCTLDRLPDGRHVVKDLHSGYPTTVNGIEVQQVSLKPGDVITLGDAKIVYAPAAAAPEAAVPPAEVTSPAPVRPRAAPAPRRQAAPPAPTTADEPAAAVAEEPQTKPPAKAEGSAPARVDKPTPSKRAPDPKPASKPRARRHLLVIPLTGLALAGIAAVVAGLMMGSGTDDAARAAADRKLERALELYRAHDYGAARIALAAVADDPAASAATRRRAARYSRSAEDAVLEAQSDLDEIWAERLDFDLTRIETSRQLFLDRHGAPFREKYDALLPKIRKEQADWVEAQVEATTDEAAVLLDRGQFADARLLWAALPRCVPPATDVTVLMQDGLAEVDRCADERAERDLATAASLAKRSGSAAAAERLERKLARYEGTGAHARIAVAIREYRSAARQEGPLAQPEQPTVPDETLPPQPTPEAVAVEAAIEEALESARALSQERDFAGAFAVLDKALTPPPPPGRLQRAAAERREDLALARDGLDGLIADINAHPEGYRRLEMGPRFVVALKAADRDTVSAAVRGGETRYRWAMLSAKRMKAILGRYGAEGDAALGVASFLRELGALEEAERSLFVATESGVATDVAFPLLARWREEDVPDGGYVAYDGRFVTPTERDRLVLEAKIADALALVEHRDADKRKAAYETLLSLGEPARDPLHQALQLRRAGVIEELSDLAVFTSSRTKSRLYQELGKRRQKALALIENAAAWPYPNPSKQNNAEVAALVDAVREIWERPFDVVAQWDEKLRDELALLTEVDEVLIRIEPSYQPNLDALRQRVSQKIDMPSYTPDSGATSARQYSLKVLAYNEKVTSTATPEELDNVRAVNEYRMMMGRRAVKVNERLVRAARGHSRHMAKHEYFDHNVPGRFPAPAGRSPGARAKSQGYGGGVGENIARGTVTGRAAFWAWFGSSGHHRNMINKGWTEMGAGRSNVSWWTQLFGRASGSSLKTPDPLPDPAPEVAPDPEGRSDGPGTPTRPEVPDVPVPGIPDDEVPEGEVPDEGDGR